MDIKQLLQDDVPEGSEFEFKHPDVKSRKIARELTAFANSGGGSVILGITESADGLEVTGVPDPQQVEEAVNQSISRLVTPRLEPDVEFTDVDSKVIVIFHVYGESILRSFKFNDKYSFPARQGSTTIYLDGHDIRDRYHPQSLVQAKKEQESVESGLQTLSKKDHQLGGGPYFIPAPNGSIAGVCTFGELYTPSRPVHTEAICGRPEMDEVEHILSCLSDTFELDQVRGSFTINQKNAAWVGSGFSNFLESMKRQQARYDQLPAEFKLDRYKCEEAIFVCNPHHPYSESLLVVYAEPWVSEDFCRHFEIHLITKGTPRDNRPLNLFGDKSGISFGNTQSISISTTEISRPEQLPVQPIRRIESTAKGIAGTENTLTGFLVKNPFAGRGELLKQITGLQKNSPLAAYERLYGHFLQYPPDDVSEIVTARFGILEYSEFVSLPLDALHIESQLDW